MIAHVDNRITYNGNGNATEFAYQFKILDRTDIKVMLTDADGKEKLLTKDYYVDVEKSVVRYPGYAVGAEVPESERPAVLPTGWKLTIYREVPVTQETDLPDQYPFNQVEAIGDKLTMIAQQLTDTTGRSLKIGVSKSTDIDTVIPWENGKSFRISDDGTKIELTEDPARAIVLVNEASAQAQSQAAIATAQAAAAAASAKSAAEHDTKSSKAANAAYKMYRKADDARGLAETYKNEAAQQAAAAAASAEEAAEKLTQLGEHEANAAASAKAAAKSAQDAASVEKRTYENAAAAEEFATASKQNAEHTAALAKESSDAKDTILSESNSMRQYMSLTKENIDAAKNQTISAAASAGDYAAQAASSQTAAAQSVEEAQRSTEEAYQYQDIATTEASKAAASAKQAQGYADSVKDVEQELRADNARLTTDLKHANRRISVLYDLGKGITHRYETDSDVAYSKAVPSGAKVMDVKMVGGKSVVGNHLVQDVKFETRIGDYAGRIWKNWGGMNVDVNDGVATFKAEGSWYGLIQNVHVLENHKYYFGCDVKSDIPNNTILAPYVDNVSFNEVVFKLTSDQWTHVSRIEVAKKTADNSSIGVRAGSSTIIGAKISCKNIQCIDLTQMFGAGNEPTLEQFQAMLTRPDYPYNAGTLVSADVTDVQVGDKVISLPNKISLKSAGSVYDSLEFYEQDGKYYQKHTQRVGVILPSELANYQFEFITSTDNPCFVMVCPKLRERSDPIQQIIVNQYTSYCISGRPVGKSNKVCINDGVSSYNLAWRNDDIKTEEVFRQHLIDDNIYLYYELATPIVTVTEVDNRFDAADCKAGDKITFVGNSDYHLPVPNEEEYLIALNEVTP